MMSFNQHWNDFRRAALLGLMGLLAAGLLTACATEPTPTAVQDVPVAAAPTVAPVPPTPTPPATPAPTPTPKLTASPTVPATATAPAVATSTPAPVQVAPEGNGSIDYYALGPDTLNREVFETLAETERACIMEGVQAEVESTAATDTVVPSELLDLVMEQRFFDDDQSLAGRIWSLQLYQCIAPEKNLGILYSSLIVDLAEQRQEPTDAERECLRKLLVNVDLPLLLSNLKAQLQSETPSYEATQAAWAFEYGVSTCLTSTADAGLETLPEPEQLWIHGYGSPPAAPPILANGLLYIGSESVCALGAVTGEEVWCFHVGGGEDNTFIVADGVVYVATIAWNVHGQYVLDALYALNADTGEEIWSTRITGRLEQPELVLYSGVLYLWAGYSHQFFALDAVTGEELWSLGADGWPQGRPLLSKGVMYLLVGYPIGNQTLYALDAATSEEIWKVVVAYSEDARDPPLPPVIAGHRIYVAEWDDSPAYSLKALDAATGESVWSFPTASYVRTEPVALDDMVFFTTSKAAYALDEATGDPVWSRDYNWNIEPDDFLYKDDLDWYPPTLVADGVYYLAGGNTIYALDAATGETLWTYASGPAIAWPVLAEGLLIGWSAPYQIFALDRTTGEEVWTRTTFWVDPKVWNQLMVSDGALYAKSGVYPASLYVVGLGAGEPLWTIGPEDGIDSYAAGDGVAYIGRWSVIFAYQTGETLTPRVLPTPAPTAPAPTPAPTVPSTPTPVEVMPADAPEVDYYNLPGDSPLSYVFNDLSETEQACVREKFGAELDQALTKPLFSGELQSWDSRLVQCLDDEKAPGFFASAIVWHLEASGWESNFEYLSCFLRVTNDLDVQLAAIMSSENVQEESLKALENYVAGTLSCANASADTEVLSPWNLILWDYFSEDLLAGTLKLADGLLYVSSYNDSACAVDVDTGEDVWCFDPEEDAEDSYLVEGGFSVHGDSFRERYALRSGDGIVYLSALYSKSCDLDAVEVKMDAENFAGWDGESGYVSTSLYQELCARYGHYRRLYRIGESGKDEVIYLSTFYQKLYALDAGTGQEIWSLFTDEQAWDGPVLHNGVLYLLTGDYEGTRRLHALDAATGGELWTVEVAYLREHPDSPLFTPSPPTVIGNRVYVAEAEEGPVYNLKALDAATGETVWSFPTASYARTEPVALDGMVFFTTPDTAYALDESTGELVWSRDYEWNPDPYTVYLRELPVGYHPTLVADGVYYLAGSNTLHALDAATGETLWSYESDHIIAWPVLSEGLLFGWTETARIFALDPATGEEVWTVPTPWAYAYPWGKLQVSDGVIYTKPNTRDAYLFAIEVGAEKPLWKLAGTDAYIISGHLAYVVSREGLTAYFIAYHTHKP